MTSTKNLYTLTGYFRRFYELLPVHPSNLSAYEALQSEYSEAFGKPRHSTYESFKAAKSRYYSSQAAQKNRSNLL